MTLNNIINRFLCHKIRLALKIVMLLFGIGTFTYLCVNIYYIFYPSGNSTKTTILETEKDNSFNKTIDKRTYFETCRFD